jgi:hypothetical protein
MASRLLRPPARGLRAAFALPGAFEATEHLLLATPAASADRRLRRRLLIAASVAVAGAAGGLSVIAPLHALIALLIAAVVACIWRWPALGAYLIVGLTPLTAGINRGSALPVLRPNEALVLLVGVALAARGIVGLRTGRLPRLRLDAVEVSIVLLAVCTSVIPLGWMAVRQQPVTSDDLLYALVLWKYLGLYAVVRMSVRDDAQIRRCLQISVASACVVAVLAIVQAVGLFGVPRLLATYYAPYGYTNAFQVRGSSTLGLPAATADLMIYNLAIVSGLWVRRRTHRAVLAIPAVLLLLGALASGEFSGVIGLVVGIACIAAVTNSVRLLRVFIPTALIAPALLWPVFATRLSGFQSGLPISWTERLQNLQTYFWPDLFSRWNFLLGVRPSARVEVATQGTGYVWIESGYTWLLWGGGLPLFAAFAFFVVTTARRGWRTARASAGASGVAGTAAFVAVIVTAVVMVFDPHLTYRGSADAMFVLIALAAPAYRRLAPSERAADVAGPIGRAGG